MHSTRTIVLTLAGLALLGCAGPRDGAKGTADAPAYFAQDFTCTAEDSTPVELGALLTAPARYGDRCIRVSGFVKANALYRDAEHAARPGAAEIGLDWQDSALARRLALGPSFATLTGRVRLCGRRKAMAALSAPSAPETGCRGATAALLVSAAQVVPTAMD